MKALSGNAWLKFPLAALALFAAASNAAASSVPADAAAATSTVLGTLPLQEALHAAQRSAVAQLPADLLPLPNSFFTLNNPYVLFADVLAMSSPSPQTASSSQIFLYDATNNLAAPGPVPLPNPLLLLACGAGLLLAFHRRSGATRA